MDKTYGFGLHYCHNMTNLDVRWLQRFQNFEKAFSRLKEALEMPKLNELERNGVVQRFDFTIELSWKTLKDFLEDKGFQFKPSPKEVFRLAQQNNYIDYAQALIDGLTIRNILAHDYSGEKFEEGEEQLKIVVFPALEKLYLFLKEQQTNESRS